MKKLQIGFLFLILFCGLRPLTYLNLRTEIAGLNIFDLFAVIISYLLVFDIAFNIRKIKLDLISISIFMFCLYCFLSILWGSQFRIIAKVTLPFIFFYSIQVNIKKPEQIKLLLTVLIISYCFPIVASLYKILQGSSIQHIEPITGLERHAGMFTGIKTFAFAMFFFSVYYYMQVIVNKLKNERVKWILFSLLIISLICLYKTYARTAFVGLAIFWTISLWGYNKKIFSIVFILSLIIGLSYSTTFQQIFFKTSKFDINVASSGRDIIWKHNFNFFLESTLDKKLIGNGLGVVSSTVIGRPNEIWSSHNDYLHLLMALGIFGLVLYLLVYFVLLKDTFESSIDKTTKFLFYGIIFSMTAMNFGSGVTLYQVGMSQQFWMFMGFLYVLRNLNETSSNGI
jgi:O-antigen ligase